MRDACGVVVAPDMGMLHGRTSLSLHCVEDIVSYLFSLIILH